MNSAVEIPGSLETNDNVFRDTPVFHSTKHGQFAGVIVN